MTKHKTVLVPVRAAKAACIWYAALTIVGSPNKFDRWAFNHIMESIPNPKKSKKDKP